MLQITAPGRTHSVSGRKKCMCGSSLVLCYGCMQSCAIHNSIHPYQSISIHNSLNVSEQEHWVTWSHRTAVTSYFWREKESNTLAFLLIHMVFDSLLHLKNQKFLFAFKTFFEKTKRFLSYQICSLTRNLELIGVW